eukprot:scaffold400_cov185-Amphora_coffeaeformis.AAC.6
MKWDPNPKGNLLHCSQVVEQVMDVPALKPTSANIKHLTMSLANGPNTSAQLATVPTYRKPC